MFDFFPLWGSFGLHFGLPNRSKTLRWRWFDGRRSHSESSRLPKMPFLRSGSSFGIHFGPPNRPRRCVGDGLMVARATLRAQDTPKCHKEASSDLGNATRHLRRRLTKLQPLFESLPRCLKGFPRRLGLFQNPTCPKPKSAQKYIC